MIANHRTWGPALLAMALSLAGCGGGGGGDGTGGDDTGGTAPPAAGDYAPLAVGDRWVYVDGQGRHQRDTVTHTRAESGQQVLVVRTESYADGDQFDASYVKTATTLTELPDPADPVAVAIGPLELLQQPFQVGQRRRLAERTITQGFDLDGDGRADPMVVRIDSEVVGTGTATVPAGTFRQAVQVTTVFSAQVTPSSGGESFLFLTTVDEWYAPEVGLVRRRTTIEAVGQRETESLELSSYVVGGRRSETRAPVLQRGAPSPGQSVQSIHRLELSFDEPVDPATLRDGGLVVRDAAGRVLPYSLTVNGIASGFEVLMFTQLPDGISTVSLSAAVTDMIGNPLVPVNFTVLADRAGPAILRSVPARDAVDVALDTTVLLEFDEAFAAGSVNTESVLLLEDGTREVPVRLTVTNDRSVVLTPLAPLLPGKLYLVQLTPTVMDRLGNSIGNSTYVASFRTIQGRLAAPARLSDLASHGLLGGDLDGDGDTDLLTVDATTTSQHIVFQLHRQAAAGGFEPPLSLTAPAREGCHGVASLRAADVDGDGRLDVVATRGSCGVEVFHQGPAGSFDRSVLLASVNALHVEVADLNGDGRPDIVANAHGGDDVSLWIQQPDGGWSAEQRVPLFNNGFGDLVVGDLDGDGRPDLVVTSGQGDYQRGIGVALQQPDGSFGPARYAAIPASGSTQAAVADVDGDGRAELLVHVTSSLAVWRIDVLSDKTLSAPRTLVSNAGVGSSLSVADFDGDGRADLLIAPEGQQMEGGVFLFLQRSDGSFRDPEFYRASLGGASVLSRPLIADLNRDGRPDIALSGPTLLLSRDVPAGTLDAGPAARRGSLSSMLRRLHAEPGTTR